MPDENQNPNSQISPKTTGSSDSSNSTFPSDIPAASPSEYFPPVPNLSSIKSNGTPKVIATLLGTLLLVAGLAAGVGLVLQPQLLNQKASDVVKECTDALPCANGYLCAAGSCIPNSDTVSCGKNDNSELPVCCTNSECINGNMTCSGTDYVCNSTGVNGPKTCLIKANTTTCGGDNP